jgi:hypothetical protein
MRAKGMVIKRDHSALCSAAIGIGKELRRLKIYANRSGTVPAMAGVIPT